MQSYLRLALAATLVCGIGMPASAEQDLTGGIGWFDISRNDDASTNFLLEWRGNAFHYGLRPVLGANVNTDGGVYGYGGLDYDWEFAPHWILTPGLAVGAWRRGDSIDLGGTLEFHESLEIGYRMDNNYRVGAQLNHTSNAGIYDHNPGVNSLMATFCVPLGN